MLIYKYKGERDNFFILYLKKNISKNKFLKMMKVRPSSFAAKFAIRIYNNIYCETIDLLKEYKNYHSREYEKFSIFLRKKYSLPYNIIESAIKFLQTDKNSSLFLKREYSSDDYNLEMFIMNEDDGCYKYLKNVIGGIRENKVGLYNE
jgi:hypothetical protein